jgi:Outer membrane receptor proteins, mostly Fe transport
MVPQEIVVGNQTAFNITLEPDVTQLSEVVVIGYGTVERRNLTSSVSALDDRQLKDVPINSAAQALSGRLAGVQVITSEGSPDADVQIRVRGGMSITGDNSPLYVVDGVQVENALSVLSPQDIESISVLKDASVTAIYGSRGANGVVIITTKSGKQGRTTVNFNSFIGVRQLANKLDVWKPYDFVKYQYERSRGSQQMENDFLDTYGTYEDIELYKHVPFVDWQEEIFGRSALQQTHNFNI